MNEKNTTNWKAGDVVIHDADAKKPFMLMRIVEVRKPTRTREHVEYVSEYISEEMRERWPGKANRWRNPVEALHDPKGYGIVIPVSVSERESG